MLCIACSCCAGHRIRSAASGVGSPLPLQSLVSVPRDSWGCGGACHRHMGAERYDNNGNENEDEQDEEMTSIAAYLCSPVVSGQDRDEHNHGECDTEVERERLKNREQGSTSG